MLLMRAERQQAVGDVGYWLLASITLAASALAWKDVLHEGRTALNRFISVCHSAHAPCAVVHA
jgi:hypothetical protein